MWLSTIDQMIPMPTSPESRMQTQQVRYPSLEALLDEIKDLINECNINTSYHSENTYSKVSQQKIETTGADSKEELYIQSGQMNVYTQEKLEGP